MTIAELTLRMIDYSKGNLRDICHFLKVHAYAATIGQLEGLDTDTQYLLEATALVHDIAIPTCRVKYGKAPGYLQEQESDAVVRAFFADTDMPTETVDRIAFLCAHHHSPSPVYGMDHQILLEADYLVNAHEADFTREHILATRDGMFRTSAGLTILNSAFSEKLSGPLEAE